MSESRKKNFSKFNQREAYQKLGIRDTLKWSLGFDPLEPSAFFHERLSRLEYFDLTLSEKAKELLIDAVFEEVLVHHPRLKIWKGVAIEGQDTSGVVDYLLAERKGYLDRPFLCVVEAKKDDFVQGEAQCLVGMQACQWISSQAEQVINIYGIVANGDIWVFYELNRNGQVYKTSPYALTNLSDVLGLCHKVFSLCEVALPVLS
jgi:hypothetical protein